MTKKDDQELQELISKWEETYKADIDSTNSIRWEWFKNISFVQGDQWTYFNRMSKKLIELPKKDPREIRVTINIIWYMLRAIRGFVLRFEPKHEVEPVGTQDINYDVAKKTSRLLDWSWVASNINKVVGDAVFNSSWASVGPVLVSWNEEDGTCKYTPINPLNVFWDSYAGDDEDSVRHIGYVFDASEDDIRNNPEYDLLKKDDKLAPGDSNDNRESILDLFEKRVLKENKDVRNIDSNKRYKGREVFYKKVTIVDGKKDTEIWVITWVNGMNKPLRHRKFDAPFFPILTLHTDQLPGKYYGTGLVKHAIPPQVAINRLESLRLSYLAMAGKYRLLTPKASGIQEVHDIGGTQILYNSTSPFGAPRELPAMGLPQDVQAQLQGMESHIQKIMGVFDQFLGQPGFSGESGRHAESMQAASANNQAEFQLNVENFIAELGYVTLWFYENYLETPIIFSDRDEKGNEIYVSAIGNKARSKKSNKDKNTVPIIKSKVRVKVGSRLAYTEQARFDRLIQLAQAQLIDGETVLETLGFGNVGDILERAKKRVPPAPQGQPQPQQGGVQGQVAEQPQQAQAQGPTDQVAIDETAQILQGQIPQGFEGGTPGAPEEHTMTHVHLLTSPDMQALPDDVVSRYIEHILAEAEQNGAVQTKEVQGLINLVNQGQNENVR